MLLVLEWRGRYPKVGALVVGTGMGWVPLLLVPEQLGGYPKVGAYKVAAELLVPERRGGYPKVGTVKAGWRPPCCWYRNGGVGALLGAFLKEKTQIA